jgi:hypothetical protein
MPNADRSPDIETVALVLRGRYRAVLVTSDRAEEVPDMSAAG